MAETNGNKLDKIIVALGKMQLDNARRANIERDIEGFKRNEPNPKQAFEDSLPEFGTPFTPVNRPTDQFTPEQLESLKQAVEIDAKIEGLLEQVAELQEEIVAGDAAYIELHKKYRALKKTVGIVI